MHFLRHGPKGEMFHPSHWQHAEDHLHFGRPGVLYVFVSWLLARDSKRFGPITVCNA